jgi:hypothetical protein
MSFNWNGNRDSGSPIPWYRQPNPNFGRNYLTLWAIVMFLVFGLPFLVLVLHHPVLVWLGQAD